MIIATDFAKFTILLWFLTCSCKGDPVMAGSVLQLREEKEFVVTVIIKLHLGGQNVIWEEVYGPLWPTTTVQQWKRNEFQ